MRLGVVVLTFLRGLLSGKSRLTIAVALVEEGIVEVVGVERGRGRSEVAAAAVVFAVVVVVVVGIGCVRRCAVR